MSTETTTRDTEHRSAFPAPVEALMPKARKLAAELGELPSRNRLMTELKIGAPKARAILTALATPTGRLHLVPTTPPVGEPNPVPVAEPAMPTGGPIAVPVTTLAAETPQVAQAADPGTDHSPVRRSPVRSWPVLLLAAPAFVAIWSGWVGLGGLTGFGIVHPLPGIADGFSINTAITLPIGVETYAAFALRAWLSGSVPPRARRFAKWSAIGSLVLGALGQVAYHLMSAAGMTTAPWQITTLVACLPVAVLGMGAALAHLLHDTEDQHNHQ